MTGRGWPAVTAGAGVAIFALSFVNTWIVQEREIRGEGYRWAETMHGAWRGIGMPVLTIAALGALAVAVLAVARLRRPSRVPGAAVVWAAAAVLGLVAATGWPVTVDGHAWTIRLTPSWMFPVGVVLALAMTVGAARAARPGRRALVAAGALAVAFAFVGVGARWWWLQAGEGTGRHWSEGSYTREAADGQPTETLILTEATYAIGGRWSGTLEWSGWTVVLIDDPACREARGTYHARDAGGDDIRFVKIVDTCRDGERGDDLETGIWRRDP